MIRGKKESNIFLSIKSNDKIIPKENIDPYLDLSLIKQNFHCFTGLSVHCMYWSCQYIWYEHQLCCPVPFPSFLPPRLTSFSLPSCACSLDRKDKMHSCDTRKKMIPGSYRPLSFSFVPGKLVQLIRKKRKHLGDADKIRLIQ